MNRLLYFGAGSHFQPVRDFLSVKEFIYVDSQPYSEFFKLNYIWDKGFYRNNFVSRIRLQASLYGFELAEERVLDNEFFWSTLSPTQKVCYTLFPKLLLPYINPTLLKFTNKETSQTIKYYISNPFPYVKTNELIEDIGNSDGLIVCGHHPDKTFLNYIGNKKINFIGYNTTWFGKDEPEDLDPDEANNIIQHMHNLNDKTIEQNEGVNKYFDKYLYVKDIVYSNSSINNYFDLDYNEWIKKENEFILTKPISEITILNSFDEFLEIVNLNKITY